MTYDKKAVIRSAEGKLAPYEFDKDPQQTTKAIQRLRATTAAMSSANRRSVAS